LKSLFYNPSFVIHLAELKGNEAFHTLNFLREHLHSADDLTVRWHWEAGSVAFWDNRVVDHRATPGGYNTDEREGTRTAIYGEKPFFDPQSKTLTEKGERQQNETIVKLGLDGF
jgi:sulfonate dioxygenase